MPNRCVNTPDSDFELLFVAVTALQPWFLCCWCMTVAVFQLMDCFLCSSRSAQGCAANIKLWSFNQSAKDAPWHADQMREDAWFWLWVVVCGGDSSAAQVFVLLMYDRSRFSVDGLLSLQFKISSRLCSKYLTKVFLPKCNRKHPNMPNRCVNMLDSDFELFFFWVAVTALYSRFLCCWCMTVAVFNWLIAFFAVQDQLKVVQQIFN